MKKFLLPFLLACVVFSPLALSAQEKTAPIKLANEADSLSYALGVAMVQSGLKQYLTQTKVLADTAAVSSEYQSKIENETNAGQKSKLQKELKFKVDSINKANARTIEEFLAGFSQSLDQGKNKSAFNSGVAIGTQILSSTENFSREILGGEGLFKKEAFVAAFSGSLRDEKLLIDNAEMLIQDASLKANQAKESKSADDRKIEYAAQIAEGEAFLAENKTKDGVVTLPSGLQYKVLTQGTGEKPIASDRVTVHYKGTLLDGTVFDSSIDRGEPITLGVGQVIKGWTEALQLMPVGSKWMLYIPYELAYGSKEQGVIKPFSNLIFEVELTAIDKD